VLHGALHHCWVTGSVRDEETVVFLPSKLREVVVPWYLQDFDSSSYETSQLVVFETDIDRDYANGATRGVLEGGGWIRRPELRLFDGDWT
jgi:hypothetical protein